jgi:hypothetical protein
MWQRQWIVVVGLAACVFVAIRVAGPLAAQQNDTAVKSDKDSELEKEKKQGLELDAQYAKAYLRLMDAILEKYENTNRRQPNTIPASVMQVIQDGARDARDRAEMFGKADPSEAAILVACAESQLRGAQESLRSAENVNAASPGNVSAPQLDILKADVALAKVRVERARHLSAESPLSTVRFELAQLREEVQQLRRLAALLGEKD